MTYGNSHLLHTLVALTVVVTTAFAEHRIDHKEVHIASGKVKISGELDIPLSDSPGPAVLIIPGDGPSKRSERFLVTLSDKHTAHGVIVLRTDKRGSGDSTGDLSAATTEDLADDALAAVIFLQSRDEVDRKRIGIIGHSEGALIAAMVAARAPVAFIVLMAYPAVGIEETVLLQHELDLKKLGSSKALVSFERNVWRLAFQAVRSGERNGMHEYLGRSIVRLEAMRPDSLKQEYQRLGLGEPHETILEMIKEIQSPWFRYLIDYNPTDELEKVECPTLALFAERDRQVPPHANIAPTGDALESGRCVSYQIQVLPGLDHHFRVVSDESTSSQESISELALRKVSKWIVDRVE